MKIDQVRKHALSLPAVTEEPHHRYASFRVHGKIFVTVPPGDTCVHVFVAEEEREKALRMHPEFTEELFWGAKAVGVRLRLPAAKPGVVRALVTLAYEARVARDAQPTTRRPKQQEDRHRA